MESTTQTGFKKTRWREFPGVVPGLRIHLPMQETQVRPLIWEDPRCPGAIEPPVLQNFWACALHILQSTRPRAPAAQWGRPPHENAAPRAWRQAAPSSRGRVLPKTCRQWFKPQPRASWRLMTRVSKCCSRGKCVVNDYRHILIFDLCLHLVMPYSPRGSKGKDRVF